MSFFAPQAYTKETLSKAFDWLQHQPASVRQAAANPDMLVSIYLQAQRQGIQRIDADAPVSSKKFIDDLKTLSRDFAQFDEAPAANLAKHSLQQMQGMAPLPARTPENLGVPQTQHNVTQSTHHTIAQTTQHTIAQSSTQHSMAQSQVQMPTSTMLPQSQPVTFTSELPQQAPHVDVAPEMSFTLDEKSLATVRKLQERFNLSSPQEALRMLLSVGSERISHWD